MLNDIFNILLPQTCLIFFIILLLAISMLQPIKYYKYARFITVSAIVCTIFTLTTVQIEPQYFGLKNSVMSDNYTLLFHFVILLSGFFITLLTKNLVRKLKRHAYTFYAIFLTAILGAINVVSSNDFLTLLVSLELLGFSTYFLIASAKGFSSKEASFKYLITSAISTCLFLFGVSYMYGITGSLNLSTIYEFISANDSSILYSMAAIMIILGLSAKLAIFPFANWIIDVYKNTETSILAFLSTIPELAIFGIICRLLVFPLSGSFDLSLVIAFIAIITAFWANTYAIKENNVKIIYACSSAANMSYILLAAGLVSVYNLSTVIFYLICYIFMNIGIFAFLNIYFDSNKILDDRNLQINNLQGLFSKNHGLILANTILILALAGIPFTSGFIAKIYLFTAIANSGLIFTVCLLLLLLLMIIALYYYLKIILPMFIKCDKNNEILKLTPNFSQKFVLYMMLVITLVIGIFPEKIIELCRFIAYNI